MKTLYLLLLVGLISTSCSESVYPKNIRSVYYATEDSAFAGARDAKEDIQHGRYLILRYDMPMARTGVWRSYKAPYENLGIEEGGSTMSKAYSDAYNRVMDKALSNRHGESYLRVRSRLLPPKGAIPYRLQKNLS